MGQKFVLLASGLKTGLTDEALAPFKLALKEHFKTLPKPFPGQIDGRPLLGFSISDNDGPSGDGTGGGNTGGAQKIILGELGQTFWQFQIRPDQRGHEVCSIFPPIIRYELCLTFDTYDNLLNFFDHSPGNQLKDFFHWVQYVAVSDPT